jgi:hypothetical protein
MLSAVESRNCGLLFCLSVITSALAAIRGVRPQITTRAFISTGFKLACSLLSLLAYEIIVPRTRCPRPLSGLAI